MTRFDSKKADAFLVAVRAGASNENAATHADVPITAVRDWIRRRPDFRRDVAKARADLELFAVGTVRRNIGEDQKAAMWFAEKARGDAELERLRELTT
jgi:hypothetical protein